MKATTIKINISGREYPVNVTPDTEANMLKAGSVINEEIKKYTAAYAVSDPRDLLAMCALQLAFQHLEKEQTEQQSIDTIESKVKSIEAALQIS